MIYPFQTPATDLEPGHIIEIKEIRHIVQEVERSETGVNVRIEFENGLRFVCPSQSLVTVIGLHEPKPRPAEPANAGVLKSAALKPDRPRAVQEPPLKVGDIVQITNKEKQLYPALVTVQAVFSWGVKGYILIPALSGRMVPMATTLNRGDFDRIGAAVILNAIE